MIVPKTGQSPDAAGASAVLPRNGRARFARSGLLALAVLMLARGAAGQEAAYRVEPGDRLTLSVLGQPELVGEFVIGGEGSLLLPLVGDVAVASLTVQEIQKRLTERLADGYLHQPVVSVRITEMRPVYVLGDVKTPGSYPFRYGASVLSTIALAGGFALPEQAQAGLRTEFLLAEERVRSLETTRRMLMLRRARLEAQRDDAAAFRVPDGLPADAELARLAASEREVLTIQRKALATEIGLLQQQKPRIEAEIAGNRAQTAAEQTQLALIQDHLASYNQLISNGLARRYTGIELQREEARNKGTIARLASELARLDLNVGEITMRIEEARNAYMRRVMAELQDTRARLGDAEIALPIAREVREARIQQGGSLGSVPAGELRRSVVITRRRDGRITHIAADAATALCPGDIVEIRRDGRPDEGIAPVAGGLRSEGELAALPGAGAPAR